MVGPRGLAEATEDFFFLLADFLETAVVLLLGLGMILATKVGLLLGPLEVLSFPLWRNPTDANGGVNGGAMVVVF